MSWLQQETCLSLRKVQQQELLAQTCSSCTHTVCTNAYHTPLKRAHAQRTAPVRLTHALCVYMWCDGAVDTVDRCRGKDGFQSACQASVGSTSTTGGLTRGLAPHHGCTHSLHHNSQQPTQLG